ncbi:MAG: hypothetical protein AAGN66_08490 [Acidobacteriota bacterium]
MNGGVPPSTPGGDRRDPDRRDPEPPPAEEQGSPRSGSPGPDETGPRLFGGPGLRVVIYFLAIHTLSQLAIAFLVQAFAGTEALTRMAEAQLPSPADRLFLLWLQAAVVPLALAATLLYLRRLDRRPASEVGLVWPAGAGGQAAAAAGLAAGGLITWRLLASPWL